MEMVYQMLPSNGQGETMQLLTTSKVLTHYNTMYISPAFGYRHFTVWTWSCYITRATKWRGETGSIFTSCSLSKSEQNYSQINKEALAFIYECMLAARRSHHLNLSIDNRPTEKGLEMHQKFVLEHVMVM